MSITTHERPGVYSSYGASSLIRGSGGRKTVGLVAVNTKATAKTVYTITSYEEAVTTFGSAGGQDMAELIRVILLNGAAAVAAVPISASTDYEAGFAVLEGQENVSVVVCDSTTQTDQQDLRDSVAGASAARRGRGAAADKVERGEGEEKGAFLDELVMHEVLSELKEIAQRDGISCTCGSHRWKLQVNYSSIDLFCADCGGAMRLPAATSSDIDDICCKTRLLIHGNTGEG